jgi:hypothetical protein
MRRRYRPHGVYSSGIRPLLRSRLCGATLPARPDQKDALRVSPVRQRRAQLTERLPDFSASGITDIHVLLHVRLDIAEGLCDLYRITEKSCHSS